MQSMRSVTYLQPGERRSCVGCHETPGHAPPTQLSAGVAAPHLPHPAGTGWHAAAELSAVGPGRARPALRALPRSGRMSAGTVPPVLTGDVDGEFTRSYANLRPFVRWYEWGGESISQIVTRPGEGSADESPLLAILQDVNHREPLELPADDLQRLHIWLDANVPFYGTYRDATRARQLAGESVEPPPLQ